jgi:inner membrane transporter RhtA
MEAVARIQWGPRRWFVPRGPRVPRTVASRFGGPGLVVASSASLQTSAALATTAFAVYGPAGTGALRFAFAAPVLLLLARPRVRGRSPRFWLSASIFGITLVALNVVLYEAIARVSLGTVVSLQFLGPLALALVGVRRRLDALWIAAATAGVLSLTGGPGRGPALGVGLALVAGALTVLSLILGRRLATESAGLDGLALAVAIAAWLTLPLALTSVGATTSPGDLVLIAAVAGLGVAVPYSLEYVALGFIPVKTFGILLSLDPAVALIAGALWLGQTLAASEVLGVGLVVVASAGVVATRP